MTDQDDKIESNDEIANPAPAKLNRRAMLRGAAAAMPAVLTLQSGAALARSSNLISGTEIGTEDAYGRMYCVDANSVYPAGDTGNLYDAGDPVKMTVSAINRRRYYLEPKKNSQEVDRSYMCKLGGPYYYENSSYQYGNKFTEVRIDKGFMVSATALGSLTGDILIKDV